MGIWVDNYIELSSKCLNDFHIKVSPSILMKTPEMISEDGGYSIILTG